MGNVGQLTVDLIVSTLHMDRIGYLSTDAVYPVIGNDPFSTKGSSDKCQLVTAIEGMFSSNLRILFLVYGSARYKRFHYVSYFNMTHNVTQNGILLTIIYLYNKVVCESVCLFPRISVSFACMGLNFCRLAWGPIGMVCTFKQIKNLGYYVEGTNVGI